MNVNNSHQQCIVGVHIAERENMHAGKRELEIWLEDYQTVIIANTDEKLIT